MQKPHFTISINAPKANVWRAMLDDKTYREWTRVFSEGSYYQGSWEKGSKILFLGPDPATGEESGMVARIVDNSPYEYVSIEHLGLVSNGVEDTTSEEARKWAHGYENYTFTETDGVTELSVDLEVLDEHVEMFTNMWPQALQKLKEIAERSQ